jgi:UDP-N-acetylglucosamine--N-acetylmuramyl-(pentapeptide) pyrophosphoryl-undecaprenol N-acetylglucosamine transferase
VWEVAAAGKPAILVPYPDATADHQRKNAEYFQRAGGAEIVTDERAAESVPGRVADLLGQPGQLVEMGEAMRAAAKPDAAERIADELIALAAARR